MQISEAETARVLPSTTHLLGDRDSHPPGRKDPS